MVSSRTPHGFGRWIHRKEKYERALMAGNSLKSDVIPALETGAWGVHLPHGLEWSLERAETPREAPRFVAPSHRHTAIGPLWKAGGPQRALSAAGWADRAPPSMRR